MPEQSNERPAASPETKRGSRILAMRGFIRGMTYAILLAATSFYAGTLAERHRNEADSRATARCPVTPGDASKSFSFELGQMRHATEQHGHIATFRIKLDAMRFALEEARACTDDRFPHPPAFPKFGDPLLDEYVQTQLTGFRAMAMPLRSRDQLETLDSLCSEAKELIAKIESAQAKRGDQMKKMNEEKQQRTIPSPQQPEVPEKPQPQRSRPMRHSPGTAITAHQPQPEQGDAPAPVA